MEQLFTVHWKELLIPKISIVELFIRGSLVYLTLLSVIRFMPNRQLAMVGLADLLVVVLIAEAAQNALVSTYTSLTGGLILLATIIFWNYLLNWLGYKFAIFHRLLVPPPLLLVKNGQIIQRHLQNELITEEELMSKLRTSGVEFIADVKKAYIEADGSFSVITYDSKTPQAKN